MTWQNFFSSLFEGTLVADGSEDEIPVINEPDGPEDIPEDVPENIPEDVPEEIPEEGEEIPEEGEEIPEENLETGTVADENDANFRDFITTVPLHGWIIAGVAFALLVSAITALIVHKAKKKPRAPGMTVGKVHEIGARDSQQDSFFVSEPAHMASHGILAVVADGMGGLSMGDQVSQTAVGAMADGFYEVTGSPEQVLLELLARANRAVDALLGPSGRRKSGSTLVAAIIRDNRFYYLSVGDSRIALLRDGALIPLNREHIFRNELALRGVNGDYMLSQIESHPKAAGLTSFLGMGSLALVDLPSTPIDVREGDRFILMSDGVYNALTDREIIKALDAPTEKAAEQLQAAIAAKAFAHQDNYTAVILDCTAVKQKRGQK